MDVRVITGSARGRKLKELEGTETRPTTGRVKESVFNIIQFDIEGRRVLDLFCGTGQLGIEALSRGAGHCTFVDSSKQAVQLTRENLRHTGFLDRAAVKQSDYLAFLSGATEKFDLIFLDPPYGGPQLEKALRSIAAIDIVSENGIIVCESERNQKPPELLPPYEKRRDYQYGQTKIMLVRRGTGA